jgi:hypothetical protein
MEERASIESYAMYIESPGEGSVHVGLLIHEGVILKAAAVLHNTDFRQTNHLTEVTIAGQDVREYIEYMGQMLWFACQIGYVKEVTSLITLGADVNFRYDAFYKTTPLMIALVEDEPQVVPLLIEAGAEVNIQDELRRTALLDAAANNEPKIVSLLLTAGANTDVQDGVWRMCEATKLVEI